MRITTSRTLRPRLQYAQYPCMTLLDDQKAEEVEHKCYAGRQTDEHCQVLLSGLCLSLIELPKCVYKPEYEWD